MTRIHFAISCRLVRPRPRLAMQCNAILFNPIEDVASIGPFIVAGCVELNWAFGRSIDQSIDRPTGLSIGLGFASRSLVQGEARRSEATRDPCPRVGHRSFIHSLIHSFLFYYWYFYALHSRKDRKHWKGTTLINMHGGRPPLDASIHLFLFADAAIVPSPKPPCLPGWMGKSWKEKKQKNLPILGLA